MGEDLERMIQRERTRPALSQERMDQMWRAVAQELAMLPAIPGQAGQTNPVTVESTNLVAAPLPSSSMQAASWLRPLALLFKGHLPWIAVSLGLGSAGGLVAGHHMNLTHRRSPTAQAVISTPPSAELLPEPGQPAAPVPSAWTQPVVAHEPPVSVQAVGTVSHRAEVRGRESNLSIERTLLQRAETAFRAGDWSTALQQTEEYSRRFPRGELSEENLYLAMRACLVAGDRSGARDRLEELHRRFPHSPLGIQPSELVQP
jgi:hypothetical protein